MAGTDIIEQNKNFSIEWRLTPQKACNRPCRPGPMTDYRDEAPQILCDFLSYHETIKAHSQKTVDEYFLDLRNFFRYMKKSRSRSHLDLDQISIMDVDIDFIRTITLTDIYGYLTYLSRDRAQQPNSDKTKYGLNASTRARKIATLRSFFNYLTQKAHLLEENPVKELDSPKLKKSLPKYLTLDESLELLESVDGKGNKVRIVYLNDACKAALARYLAVRRPIVGRDQNALFLSSRNQRISRSNVHALVKKHLSQAGLDSSQYSSHKLRHTAATLMLQNGVDVKAVQEVLGHEHLNTTEIYTHIDNEALRVAARANPLGRVKPPKDRSGAE